MFRKHFGKRRDSGKGKSEIAADPGELELGKWGRFERMQEKRRGEARPEGFYRIEEAIEPIKKIWRNFNLLTISYGKECEETLGGRGSGSGYGEVKIKK